MAYGDLTLPAARLRNRGGNVAEWDWYAQTDDPQLPAALTPGSTNRFLSRCSFYRGGGTLSATTSRQVNIDFEESAGASRGTGDDLTGAFEQNGGVVITLGDGKTLTLGSPASAGDVTDHYSWTVDADETEFDYEDFDALYDALRASVTAGTPLAGTMRVHDGADPTGPTVVRVAGSAAASWSADLNPAVVAPSEVRPSGSAAAVFGAAPNPAVAQVVRVAGSAAAASAATVEPTVAPPASRLPYELELAHLSRSGEFLNVWQGTIPADRITIAASSMIEARISNALLGGGAPRFDIILGTTTPGPDFDDELESARLVVQNADGDVLLDIGPLADSSDSIEPYQFVVSNAEYTALNAYVGALTLNFRRPQQVRPAATATAAVSAALAPSVLDIVRVTGQADASWSADLNPAVVEPPDVRVAGSTDVAFAATLAPELIEAVHPSGSADVASSASLAPLVRQSLRVSGSADARWSANRIRPSIIEAVHPSGSADATWSASLAPVVVEPDEVRVSARADVASGASIAAFVRVAVRVSADPSVAWSATLAPIVVEPPDVRVSATARATFGSALYPAVRPLVRVAGSADASWSAGTIAPTTQNEVRVRGSARVASDGAATPAIVPAVRVAARVSATFGTPAIRPTVERVTAVRVAGDASVAFGADIDAELIVAAPVEPDPPGLAAATLRASAFAAETDDVWLVLVTLDHPDLAEPIRVVNDNEPLESRGHTFVAFAFDIVMPLDAPDRPPFATLTIDNVSRELIETIRELATPPTVALEFVRAAAPDLVELSWHNFVFRDIRWTATEITGQLALADILTEPYPADSFTPASFRGLA